MMSRIVILGNAGGGKSTLARKISAKHGLSHFEIDKILWREGWVPTAMNTYTQHHEEIISGENWIIEGLGHLNSLPLRIARATEIILIDMPLWMHFWLAAERQIAWHAGELNHSPAGLSTMPPTKELFRTISEIDRDWMPGIRSLCAEAESTGTRLTRICGVDELDDFTKAL